jgi:hypothetical protein
MEKLCAVPESSKRLAEYSMHAEDQFLTLRIRISLDEFAKTPICFSTSVKLWNRSRIKSRSAYKFKNYKKINKDGGNMFADKEPLNKCGGSAR